MVDKAHIDYEYIMMDWMDRLYKGNRLDDVVVMTNIES